jgi:NADP-dependent 3-hydroxy acid dehydrogenase YdfG
MQNFNDKVCVITGAGSGIGRALAIDLAQRGARLALSDVNADAVALTADSCRRHGAEAESYALDVSDREAVFAHAEAVGSSFGTANLVVNNAGVAMHKTVLEASIEDYQWITSINYWGVVYGTKAFLPPLIASGDGYVVNISSVFGIIAVPGQSAYNATKFAVRGFTEALRQEMLADGHPVGVSCVHPGGIRTGIARAARTAPSADRDEMATAFDRMAHTSPERAARTIIRGIKRRRARILIGGDAYAIDVMQRALGSAYQGIVYRAARRAEPD